MVILRDDNARLNTSKLMMMKKTKLEQKAARYWDDGDGNVGNTRGNTRQPIHDEFGFGFGLGLGCGYTDIRTTK